MEGSRDQSARLQSGVLGDEGSFLEDGEVGFERGAVVLVDDADGDFVAPFEGDFQGLVAVGWVM